MLLTRGISDEELMKVSRENPLLRFERNSDGSLVTMAPAGGISSNREASASSMQKIRIILGRESISLLSLISSASCRRNILFV